MGQQSVRSISRQPKTVRNISTEDLMNQIDQLNEEWEKQGIKANCLLLVWTPLPYIDHWMLEGAQS